MTQNQSNKEKLTFRILSVVFLIICLAGTFYYVRTRKYYTMSSDEASELVLGKLLADEGKLITENWYYSTELRVLNTNIFYSLFFRFTDSWHRVRMLSCACMYLLLLLSYLGLSHAFGFKRSFSLSAAVLFIPFSAVYFNIVLKGAYYFPVITVCFLTLFFAESYLNLSGWKAHALLVFSFIFSVLNGMGGARLLIAAYFPLLAAALILWLGRKKDGKASMWLKFAAVSFAGSLFGYLINTKLLAKVYHFELFDDVSFILPDLSRIRGVLNGFLTAFGYREGGVFSPALLQNAVALAWVGLFFCAVFFGLRNREDVHPGYVRFACFAAVSFLIFTGFYAFTDAPFHERYTLPIVVSAIPVVTLFFDRLSGKKKLPAFVFPVLVVLTAFSGLFYYVENGHRDDNAAFRKLSDFLTAEGYHGGYSSFWQANLLTEFSNGQIEMWSVVNDDDDRAFLFVEDINQTYHWLQKVSHDTTHPEGELFLLFTEGEFGNNLWKDRLREDDIIYRKDGYVVLGFEDYESLIACLYE